MRTVKKVEKISDKGVIMDIKAVDNKLEITEVIPDEGVGSGE